MEKYALTNHANFYIHERPLIIIVIMKLEISLLTIPHERVSLKWAPSPMKITRGNRKDQALVVDPLRRHHVAPSLHKQQPNLDA